MKCSFLLLLVVAFAYPELDAIAQDGTNRLYIIKEKNIRLFHAGRVVGFHLSINRGAIKSISDIPPGWSIELDNDPSWEGQASGAFIVGAAAVTADRIARLFVFSAAPLERRPPIVTLDLITSTDFAITFTNEYKNISLIESVNKNGK